jgi:uncharacterized membrane protein YraQ (UPF0718 family)
METLKWLNSQLLKMDWLSSLVRYAFEDLLGINLQSRMGASLHFMIYDTIKIFILLSVLIFVVSLIQSYFPPERSKRILGGMDGLRARSLAALLGTVTPFCSCSSIPLFIGFTSAGLPLGVTFAFLISSPLVDLASLVLLASIFSWPIAVSYVVSGLVFAVLGGTVIAWLKLERFVEPFVLKKHGEGTLEISMTYRERTSFAFDQVKDVFRRVWIYVVVGVGIGALIHNWIPQEFITAALGKNNWWSVPVAALIGIPMYADIFGTLPVAEALLAKGVSLGTVLAFMMSVTALSLPSLVMLK